MSLSLVLQNRWEILKKLEGNDNEVEIMKFATSSSKEEEDKKNKKEEGKKSVDRFHFETRIDRFNKLSDDVKSLVRRRRRIELINEIPVKSLIRKRRGEMRGRIDLINRMPDEVKSLIFSKVGAIEILLRLQYVCSSWWKLSKDPYLFRVIHAGDVGSFSASKCSHCYRTWNQEDPSPRDCEHYTRWKQHWVRRAVDRSCGQLTELHIGACANDELLHYVLDKSPSLKCLVLKSLSKVSTDGLIEAVGKVPLLEELELTHFDRFSMKAIAAIGRSCLNLHKFTLNFDYSKRSKISDWYCDRWYEGAYDVEAFAIARNMPKLRSLTLLGNLLTNKGLHAILDGCPCLEYLNIDRCRRELQKQCEQRRKNLTIPDYALDDYDKVSVTDLLNEYHDFVEVTEWSYTSSSEEDSDSDYEDILKFLPAKANTFYI